MAIGDIPLKLNRDAKAAIQLVFEDLGGTCRLLEWANEPQNIGTFYTQIWSKIIPKDIKAEVDGNIVIEIQQFGDSNSRGIPQRDQNILEAVATAIVLEESTDGDTD